MAREIEDMGDEPYHEVAAVRARPAVGRWVCDSDRRPVREADQDAVELARLLEVIICRLPGSST